jgi:vitamin B12 transporter
LKFSRTCGARREPLLGLFTGLLTCIAALSAQAQTVVITGSREPMAPERLAADVVVIEGAALRQTTADSLADLLRREAGIQLSRSGGPGQSSGLFIRGTASQTSLVLVDGVRVGSATLGSVAVEGLSLAGVERIEVLRGPASSLYGADAVGGVVNIITRSGSPGVQADLRLAAGGYGSQEGSVGVRGAQGPLDFSLSLASERSDGVSALRPGDAFGNHNPDRDGYRLDTVQARAGFKPAAGHRVGLSLLRTKLNSQYDGSEFLPPSFAQDPSPDFRTRLSTSVTALDWRGTLATGWQASARVSRSEDDSQSGGTQTDRFRTVRQHAGAQLAWQTGAFGQLVAAVEQQRDQAQSSSYLGDVQRRNTALVLELTGSAQAFSWQADVRRDDSSDFGAVTTARAGGSWALLPGLRLRALAGSTVRAPSFNDLYFPGYGVATLQPEKGQSVELGLAWRGAASDVSATVYRNRVRDLVAYESNPANCPPDPAYSFGCAANVNRAQLQGATLAASHRQGAFTVRTQLDALEARDRNTGNRLPRRAAHQGTLGLDWAAGAWSAGASVLRLGARPDGGKTLDAETTLDLQAGGRLAPTWTLQAKLLNATDRDREPARDYQGLGRQAWLVLRHEPRF